MNWSEFQSQGEKLTEREINRLEIQILKQYDLAYNAISEELQKQYAKLLSGVPPEDYYNEMMKFNRLAKLQEEVKKLYTEYSKQAGRITENISFVGFSNNYYRYEYMASWMGSFDVGILPYKLAEYAVYGMADSWKAISKKTEKIYGKAENYKAQSGTITEFLISNRKKELQSIQNGITQGLLQGKSYPKMVDDIKNIIGKQMLKDGALTATGAKASAMRIIRTESHRTMAAGHYAATKYLDSEGVDVKRKLIAVLDNRTRSQSASMDGQTVGVDEPFKYPNDSKSMYPGNSGTAKYDINDRERVIDIINNEDPNIRVGRNPIQYLPNGEKNPDYGKNETFSFKGFDQWAKEHGLIRNKYGELLFPEK